MSRTPSASAHKKVVETAIELLAERGVEATSMDAIAEKSGVSKATIYKHWTNKEALLLEAIAEVNELRSRPKFDSGDVKADVIAVLSYRPRRRAQLREAIMRHFVAYSSRNPELSAAWREMVMDPPRRELLSLLKAGIANRELSAELDTGISLALLLGPIMYWYVFLRQKTANPRTLAETVVEAFWRAFGTNP
jgi:AcrR family transcriptional regulator